MTASASFSQGFADDDTSLAGGSSGYELTGELTRPYWSLRSTHGYDPASRVITYMLPMSGSPYMKNSTSPSCGSRST